MADPPAPPHANSVSQEDEEVLGRVYTVRLDVGAMPVGDVALDNDDRVATGIFSPEINRGTNNSSPSESMPALGSATLVAAEADNSTDRQGAREGEGGGVAGPSRRQQSNPKFRYSNRKLVAPPEFYLRQGCRGLFTGRNELIGQVKACARAANGNTYTIQWKRDGVLPMPASINPVWLRENFPKEMEPKLQQLIEHHDDVYPGSERPAEISVAVRNVATPRGMAASHFRTASTLGSSSGRSTVSTLTSSNGATNRLTRSATRADPDQFDSMIDSDIEDGSDVDEDDECPLILSRRKRKRKTQTKSLPLPLRHSAYNY